MILNIKDKRILFELEKDARQSNASIAKAVGLSKEAIGYRITQLERKGIIRGYRTLIDVSKIEYTLYRVYFKWIDISRGELDKIVTFLKKERNVWWIGKLDGEWDFIFAYWSKTSQDFYNFYKLFSEKFRKHIKEKLISTIVNYKEIPRRYLINSSIDFNLNIPESKIEKVDEVDIEILRMLSRNSRIPLIEIASKLKVDNMTVFHRIKKLKERKIIIGYKVDIDVAKLKRDFYTVEIDLNDFSEIEELKDKIYSLPELTARSVSIGGYDIEFDLELENSQEYYKITENLRTNFPCIREIRYFRVIENYKIIYMPEE